VLRGLAGDDNLNGGNGNDTLIGGLGNDTLTGGIGTDTAEYSDATSGVTVNLQTLVGQAVGGGLGTDTLSGIENLTGSTFDDTLTGDIGNNVLRGLAGNDTLNGFDGNDILIGGLGNDALNGGNGSDTADYSDAASGGVTVNLNTLAAQNVGGGLGSDTLSSIENLTGSNFNDVLIGDGNANVLTGGGGADSLTGGLGADTFLFKAITDSQPGVGLFDTIADFQDHAGGGLDTIDLSAIDGNTSTVGTQHLTFGGSSATVVANSVTWTQSGGNTIVQADVDGNTLNGAEMQLVLTGLHTLGITDFQL
jgi:Ca2+-binding RTX toxin-like protein